MRVDASQVLTQGGVKTKQGSGALTDALRGGNAAQTGVLDGDEDLSLSRPELTRGFTDKTLAPFAAKLAELNMTVTEDTARSMRELMTQYPRLSMDEAAFLASNKITGDEHLMRAALNVLSGGEKTHAMIEKILYTLSGGGQGESVNPGTGTARADEILGRLLQADNFHVSGEGRAPLTELIAAVVRNASGFMALIDGVQAEPVQVQTASPQNPQMIISQPDGNMQLNNGQLTDEIGNLLHEDGKAVSGDGKSAAGDGKTPEASGTGNAAQPELSNTQSTVMAEGRPGTAQAPGIPAAGMQPQGEVPGTQTQAPGTIADGASSAGQPTGADMPREAQPQAPGTTQVTGQAQSGAQTQSTGSMQLTGADSNTAGNAQEGARSVQSAVAGLLSEVPQFKGTPQTALDKFSDMLLRIAKDTGIGEDGKPAALQGADDRGQLREPGAPRGEPGALRSEAFDIKLLASQLEKMFTRIGDRGENAGMRLREAREELFARLTLVQEEIARASQPMREQLLSQTQRLMDHVRLINSIEQFAYMQLPVQLRDEQKTAELYVFKRKGGKRADPDNVNILLSIDLEFMGHWEALLNIKGKDVYLNMEVAGEAQREHFSANTVLLHEMLAEEGFKLMNTNIKISQEETTPLTALSAFDRYTGKDASGRIDFFL